MSNENQFLNLIDHHIFYRVSTYIYYTIFIFLLYLSFEDGKNPIIPNIIILFFSTTIIYLSAQSSQVIEPKTYTTRKLRNRLILSSLPPLLASIELFRYAKFLRKKGTEFSIWINFLVLSIIFGFLTIYFILVILLIQIASTQTHALYLLTIGIWGYVGIFIADSNLLYSSEIQISISKIDNKFEKPKIFHNLITKLYFTRKRRLSIFLLNNILVIIFLMFAISFELNPFSV